MNGLKIKTCPVKWNRRSIYYESKTKKHFVLSCSCIIYQNHENILILNQIIFIRLRTFKLRNLILGEKWVIHTATTESQAATAKISAQDTIGRPQALSTSDLILSITSNPLAELLLARAVFSLSIVAVWSRRIEASQPYNYNHISNKYTI